MPVFYIVLVLLFKLTKSEDCVIDNRSSEIAWEQKLRDDLSSRNDILDAPANNTYVAVAFIIKSFYFDDNEEVFSINSWLLVSWRDHRLAWEPNEYDGIKKISVNSLYIWTPTMKLYNHNGINDLDFFVSICDLHSKGNVICAEQTLHQTTCSSKLKNWPHDIQNCTFKFGRSSGLVTFILSTRNAVSVSESTVGPGWNITEYTSGNSPRSNDHSKGESPTSYIQFYISFLLKRQGQGLAAIVVVPPIVLSALTLIALTLNVERKARLSVLCFSLLNQFFFLQEISSDIPKQSVDTPTILIYLLSHAAGMARRKAQKVWLKEESRRWFKIGNNLLYRLAGGALYCTTTAA
ncbi:neuronal acetylcholine receptor subunit beta-2-like [Battus philenor]|uniref:neuronal acetylcholine receptor subunit beta-2-like n=1 Tax=Battus philenor TaxID=42288 RepID=UPI0035D11727